MTSKITTAPAAPSSSRHHHGPHHSSVDFATEMTAQHDHLKTLVGRMTLASKSATSVLDVHASSHALFVALVPHSAWPREVEN